MQSIHVRYKKQLKKFGIDLLFLCITYLQTLHARVWRICAQFAVRLNVTIRNCDIASATLEYSATNCDVENG